MEGEVVAKEKHEWKWVKSADLNQYDFLPANKEIIKQIRQTWT